jgi:hypothetical protein
MANPFRPLPLKLVGLSVLVAGGLVAVFGWWASTLSGWDESSANLTVVGAVIALAGAAVVIWHAVEEAHRTEAARQALHEAELRARDSLELRALWEVTNRRLELYHRLATRHAKTSFYSAQAAMAIGFALLIVFAVLAARAPTTAASIVTGTLGTASAAFAGYIGRTFVRSQEASATHLRTYFDQPVELFRYLAAERLLEGVDSAQRSAVVADLARVIVAPNTPAGTSPAPAVRRRPWWRRDRSARPKISA